MKKTILFFTLLLSGFVFETASAQVRIGVNINIGTQPVWGPVGYDHVEYYYMPDIDAFYYVPNRQYIYEDRGRWIFTTVLPPRYSSYDLYSGYKVVINEQRPYRNAGMYRTKYLGYKGNHSQEVIRNSRDSRYFENRGHPEYNNWKKDRNQKKYDSRSNNDNREKNGNGGKNGNHGNKGKHKN